MSAAARLAAFAALLVAVFVIAAVVGGAVGPERDGESRAPTFKHDDRIHTAEFAQDVPR